MAAFQLIVLLSIATTALTQTSSVSTTDQTASCMVCNTNVNVPTPSCGVSSTQVAAMEQKLQQLAVDVSAVAASSCCADKVSIQSAPANSTVSPYSRFMGFFVHDRIHGKPGDGRVNIYIVDIETGVEDHYFRYSKCCFQSLELWINVKRKDEKSGLTVLVMRNDTTKYSADNMCSGLTERCRFDVPASAFAGKVNHTMIDIGGYAANCMPEKNDLFGWYTVRDPVTDSRGIINYELVDPSKTNYCMGDTLSTLKTELDRTNRQYSLRVHYKSC